MVANWDGTDTDNQLPVPISVLREIEQALVLTVGLDSAVGTAGRSGHRIPVEARSFVSSGPPRGPPSLLYDAYWVFPSRTEAGAWCSPPTSLQCWVANGLEPYLRFPSVFAQECHGLTFTFIEQAVHKEYTAHAILRTTAVVVHGGIKKITKELKESTFKCVQSLPGFQKCFTLIIILFIINDVISSVVEQYL